MSENHKVSMSSKFIVNKITAGALGGQNSKEKSLIANKEINKDKISELEYNNSGMNQNIIKLNEEDENQKQNTKVKTAVKDSKRENQKQGESKIHKEVILEGKKRGRPKNDEKNAEIYSLNSLYENNKKLGEIKNKLLEHLKKFYGMQDREKQAEKIRNAESFDNLMESLEFDYLKVLIDEVFYDREPMDGQKNKGEIFFKEHYVNFVEKNFVMPGISYRWGIHRWKAVKSFFRLSEENETEYLNSKSHGIKEFVDHIRDNLSYNVLFKLAGIKEPVGFNFGKGNCLINAPVVALLSNLRLIELKKNANNDLELHISSGYPSWLHESIIPKEDKSEEGILSKEYLTYNIKYNLNELYKEIKNNKGSFGQIQTLLRKFSELSFSERCKVARKLAGGAKIKYNILLILGSYRKVDWIFDEKKIVGIKTTDDLEKAKDEFNKKVEEQKGSLSSLINVDMRTQNTNGLSADEERKRFLELFFWPLGDKENINKAVNEIIDLYEKLPATRSNKQKKSSKVNNALIQTIISSGHDDKVMQGEESLRNEFEKIINELYQSKNVNNSTKMDIFLQARAQITNLLGCLRQNEYKNDNEVKCNASNAGNNQIICSDNFHLAGSQNSQFRTVTDPDPTYNLLVPPVVFRNPLNFGFNLGLFNNNFSNNINGFNMDPYQIPYNTNVMNMFNTSNNFLQNTSIINAFNIYNNPLQNQQCNQERSLNSK